MSNKFLIKIKGLKYGTCVSCERRLYNFPIEKKCYTIYRLTETFQNALIFFISDIRFLLLRSLVDFHPNNKRYSTKLYI